MYQGPDRSRRVNVFVLAKGNAYVGHGDPVGPPFTTPYKALTGPLRSFPYI